MYNDTNNKCYCPCCWAPYVIYVRLVYDEGLYVVNGMLGGTRYFKTGLGHSFEVVCFRYIDVLMKAAMAMLKIWSEKCWG